jgi:hypothetical protein
MGSGTPNKGQPVGLCLAALEGSTAGPASRVHYDVKGRARYRYLHELGSHACIPAMSTRSCKDTRHGHSDILRERLRRHKLHPEGKQGPLGGVQSQARRHPRSCGTVKRLRKGRARARGRDPSNLRMLAGKIKRPLHSWVKLRNGFCVFHLVNAQSDGKSHMAIPRGAGTRL